MMDGLAYGHGETLVFATVIENRTNTWRKLCTFLFRYYVSFLIKVKANFTLEQASKAQRGSRGIVLLFR